MPLNIRDHSLLMGETMMTVWFTKYGVSMERLDEGMSLVRDQAAEQLEQIPKYEMAPATIDPIERGLQYAENEVGRNEVFKENAVRDFDAIVRATVIMVKSASVASFIYAPVEEAMKQILNQIGMNEGPQRE